MLFVAPCCATAADLSCSRAALGTLIAIKYFERKLSRLAPGGAPSCRRLYGTRGSLLLAGHQPGRVAPVGSLHDTRCVLCAAALELRDVGKLLTG